MDLDFEKGRVEVNSNRVVLGDYSVIETSPKSAAGLRTIDLDPQTISVLKKWELAQKAERLSWGPAYEQSGYIFTRENGEPLHPQTVSDIFDARVRACKLKKLPFHSLRHTHATLWLKAGQSIKVLSERLGHSDIRITLGTYGHVLPGMQKEGAEAFGQLMAGGE